MCVLKMLDVKGRVKQILGKGNFWIVKEILLENPIIINGKLCKNVACKFSIKNSQFDIERNFKIYQEVKKSKFPTLKYLEKGRFNNEDCLIVENLNNRENALFVSPNTLRNEPNPYLCALLHKEYNYVPSISETYLTNNRINLIKNFDTYLSCLEKNVSELSKNGLGLCPDALFWGVDKKTMAQLTDCIIADFDTIEINNANDGDFDELFNGNMNVVLQALYEFILFFVVEERQKKYIEMIHEKQKEYDSEC